MFKDHFVEIRHLSFKREDKLIFNDVDLTINRGKITAIMGPSGTGKTTLLKLIGGQLKPDQGEITIDGNNLSNISRTQLFKLRERIGMLFQSGALFSDLTVFENVAFPMREHTQLPNDIINDLVSMKLQAVGLRGAKDLMPSELSGGMARRVALARAIALDPDMIMYDEPFTGQDPITKGVLVKLIKLLNDSLNITSILVSHDVQETCSIADFIYLIANGKVIGSGTPSELMNNPSLQIRQFMQGLPDGPVPFHYPTQQSYHEAMLHHE